jgi:hypothetical protein
MIRDSCNTDFSVKCWFCESRFPSNRRYFQKTISQTTGHVRPIGNHAQAHLSFFFLGGGGARRYTCKIHNHTLSSCSIKRDDKQYRQCTYNVTMRRVYETIVVVENQ